MDCDEATAEGFEFNKDLFQPLCDNATISLCVAFCAILEFKRACRLPFSTIHMFFNYFSCYVPPITVYHKQFMHSKNYSVRPNYVMKYTAFVPTAI